MCSRKQSLHSIIIFISIWISQFFCAVGFAYDLRDLLLPGDFVRSLGLTPSPLDMERRQIGEKLRSKRVFSLSAKLDHLSTLSKAELEEILNYRELITRQLLLKINENQLSSLKGFLKAKAEAKKFEANKAYLAAFLAKDFLNFQIARESALDAALGAATAVGNAAGEAVGEAAGKGVRKARKAAAWRAAGEAARITALEARWSVGRAAGWDDASADAFSTAYETLINTLPKLEEGNAVVLGQKAYALSELINLNWVEKNGLSYFERAFYCAYYNADGSITVAQAKDHIHGNINNPILVTNPFIIELKYFLDKIEAKINKISLSLLN